MEQSLLACALHSRQDYELIVNHIKLKSNSYSKEMQVLMGYVGEYYQRDPEAQSVDSDVLMAQVEAIVRSEKLVARLGEYVSEARSEATSLENVKQVVLLAKQQEVADKLSAALVSDLGTKGIDELIEELKDLRSRSSLDGTDDDDILHNVNLHELMEQEYDPTNVIQLYPKSLNDRLDAGAKRGHHVTIFGMSNIGKSAFTINLGCGVARQGKRVMHLINEDRSADIYIRYVSNLSGMDKHSIRDNPDLATEKAGEAGLDNVIVKDIKPGSPEEIKRLVEKYKPDVVIVDQLRNLNVKADTRVNQLERAATEMRNIAKQCNVLVVSVTQAGDSARDKLILDGGDIDFSNVGIPAQADLLIGIGCDEKHDIEGLRILTLIKNKIGAQEDHFPVKIVKSLSRYLSV